MVAHLMRFLDVILGILMAAPTRLLPVTKMPLHRQRDRVTNLAWSPVDLAHPLLRFETARSAAYHAAPRMDVPTHSATPITAQK